MTATDELRRMLDERGVEWSDSSDENVLHTTWNAMRCWFTEYPDGWTGWGTAMSGSPEQAIEATLGRGTCSIVKTWSDSDFVDGWRYRCSECMCFIPFIERDPETGDVISAANYCPNCGRKVVGE